VGESGSVWGRGVRVFIGEYEHSLDGKNRLNVPAKFREIVDANRESKTLYVTRGLDTCLFLYTKTQWEAVARSLKDMSFTGAAARQFKRIFFANAREVELDEQGRILIPESLKADARITRSVTVVGVDDRIEIWDRELWKAMKSAPEGEYEELAEKLFGKEGDSNG